MGLELKDLPCGCRIYIGGRGETARRCEERVRLEEELVKAAEHSRGFDGSDPEAEKQLLDADRALLAHDGLESSENELPREFTDEATGNRARITSTELIIYTGPLALGERSHDRPTTYTYHETCYPLEIIGAIWHMNGLDGSKQTALKVRGENTTPGLVFRDPATAESFERTLEAALGAVARSG